MVVSVVLGEDDDANIVAVKSEDENTAIAMTKIKIAIVANKIFLIKDEYNIPNAWWVVFGEVGVTSYM